MPEEFANHSESVQETAVDTAPQTDIQATPNSEQTPPQEQPRGINVKYNKEDRFVPDDEVPTWVQKGLNYDKVAEKAKEADRYQQMLDRTAKFYGYDNHDDYMAALEQAEQERKIQEEAAKLGVDEEVIRNHLQPLNQKLSEYERQLSEIKQQEALRNVEAQLQDLSSRYSDFDKFKPQVFDLAMKGYSLEDAYKIASYDERVNTAKLEAQQETIRNLNQNAASSTGALGADAPDPIAGYMGMSAAEKRAFREKVKSGR